MNIHEFDVKNILGEDITLEQFKGKKLLIVNTASECGLTPQYEKLEKLYNDNKDNDFEIIGFPCNDFGAQEPGSEKEIQEFCKVNYGVSFPMMSKISVKGEDKHPIYEWLLNESEKKNQLSEVKWNFQKFLVDEEGQHVKTIEPTVEPDDSEITNWINDK